ncbi:hypothetical protein FSARC_12645 [Fusarium sarcochroum]|uniref:Mitochondrial division protein 1 n=1 Tax=Fusarium sarcochroum TaxID=1208366 RepID=A0A8H4WVL2_9HYPO|nr:hypothetical protein FSARC_12645 [Fusarium sarcochroum]
MPDASGSTWRNLFGCCGEKAQGQVEGAEPVLMPKASSAPREEARTASLPQDQVSLRSLPARNGGVISSSLLNEPVTESTPSVQNEPATPNFRLNPHGPNDHEAALQNLWAEAITKIKASKDGNKLAEVMDAQENTQPGNDLITSDELIRRLEKEMKRVGLKGKMADTMDKVVPHLNRFAIVGDVAVSANPNPAALPWAAVRFTLLNLTAGGDIRAKVVEGTARVTILVFECSVYQRLYLDSTDTEDPKLFGRLRETIVNSFVNSLRFLGFALNRQRSSSKVATDAFKVQEFVGYMEQLAEAEKQLHEAAGLCEKHLNSKDRERLNDLYMLMADIQKASERFQSQLKDLLLLDPLAASEHIHHPPDSFCLNGTREAVLHEIHDWVNDPKGPSVCWLPGLAGTGKSTIARTISRDLKGTALAGNFFFKRGVANRGDATRMVPLIAYQLALNLPPVAEHISEALKNDPSSVTAPLAIQWSKLIIQPVSKLTANELPTTLVLVIDALDECDSESDRRWILQLITISCPMNLKVFLTSRPELDIEGYFATEEPSRHEIVLHRVKLQDIQRDIETFLKHSIEEFVSEYNRVHPAKRSQLAHGWPGNERQQWLITRSVPLFIAAATFMRMIRDHKWSLSPDRKVDFIIEKSSNVTSKYGVLYEPVLNLILSGTPDEAQNETKGGFLKVVGSIIMLADPLSTASLAGLLDVEVPEVDSQIDPLRSVLDIPADDRPIGLFHLSFRDYLLSQVAGDFRVDASKVHANLASRCMQIMRTRLKTDICGLELPGISRADIDQDTISKHIPPELWYACTYWVHHLKGSGQRVRDDDRAEGVLSFLRHSFLNWLEVLCLAEVPVNPRDMLENLQSIVEEDAGTEVLQFLHDARNFWSYFGDAMKRAPLQLYQSGIVFCPRASTAPQPLKDRRYPRWIAPPSAVDHDWMPYVQTLENHSDKLGYIAFLGNGRLASGGGKGKIQVWDPASGSYLQMHGKNDGLPTSFASWRDIKIASGSRRNSIKIWSLVDGTCLQDLQVGFEANQLAFSDDGKFLCVTSSRPRGTPEVGRIVDLTSGQCVRHFNHEGDVELSALSERGQWIARTIGKLILLSRWSAHSEPVWVELGPHSNDPETVIFSTSGTVLASVFTPMKGTSVAKVWHTETGECLHTVHIPEHSSSYPPAVTEKLLAVVLTGSRVVLVDLGTGAAFKTLRSSEIRLLTFSPDGKLLATANPIRDQIIRIWDPAAVQSSEIIDIHSGRIDSLIFMADGSTLLSESRSEVKIWDVPSGKCSETLPKSRANSLKPPFAAALYEPLFAIQVNNKIEVWRHSPLECIRTFEYGDSRYMEHRFNLAISASGERLAIGLDPSAYMRPPPSHLEVWDVKTGKVIQRLRDVCYPVSFSFDGERIVSISGTWAGRMWDSERGGQLCAWSTEPANNLLRPDQSFFDMKAIANTTIREDKQVEDLLKPYHISREGIWLMKHGEKLLWMPPDYRPSHACISGSTIAIGAESGRVLFLHLGDEG